MMRARQASPRGLRSDPLPAVPRLPPKSARFLALALAAGVLWPAAASAQKDTARVGDDWGGVSVNAAETPRAAARPPDFLFAAPKGALTLRLGAMLPRAGSDVFSYTEPQLTVKHSDFYAPLIGAQFSFKVTPRFDFLLDGAWTRSSTRSEYIHYLDNNTRPIEQWTRFIQVPLTAGFKAYLTPRGRQIGHFAWVPTRVTPFVGAAGGIVWHRFQQTGDFVDETSANLDVFSNTYTSSGWSPTVQLLGGTDVALGRRTALNVEARWGWSSADMGQQFADFQKIDLAGLQATVGFSWRY